jgi:acyl carrier protein
MPLNDGQVAQIRRLIAEIIEVDEEQLKPDVRFEDVGADSLRAIEIMAQLEKSFGVSIQQDRLAEMATLGGVCEVMQSLLPAQEKRCDLTVS